LSLEVLGLGPNEVDFRLGLEVYQEPRLTYDPELEALSPFCDSYTLAVCKWNRWQRLTDFATNQNNASIPVLNKRQELTNQINASFGVRHSIDQSEKGLQENYSTSGWVHRNKVRDRFLSPEANHACGPTTMHVGYGLVGSHQTPSNQQSAGDKSDEYHAVGDMKK